MAYPAVRCLNSRYTLYGAQETRAPYLFKFDYNACSASGQNVTEHKILRHRPPVTRF